MIVDTSVIVAILRDEPDSESLAIKLANAQDKRMSAGSWIELGAVTSDLGDDQLPALLDQMLARLEIRLEPVTLEQARIGHEAYRRFGKGHHPARLNFGDCFSYALAKATGAPLLYKGDDFGRTDVPSAS